MTKSLRELTREEMELVSGAGARGAAVGQAIGAVLDFFGNQDGDAFDEGAVVAGAAAAGLGAAASVGCAPCGPAAGAAGVAAAGLAVADTFGT